ncbi:hypothetical protein H0H81_010920 [Sphagnurus paluster]|uniref:Hpc2-related domain-containing protein n=1 Tax=Sphagnurus paluster TaxID=117069 RepID=A0A9P7G0P2_9AGAR|nr:hypothetical protein H0H81_010920 [Sphagnurus paluster]
MDVEMGFGDASSSPSHVTNPPRSSSASASSRQSSVVHLGTNLYPSVVLDSEDSGTTPPSPQAPTVTASANLKPTSSAKPRSTKPKARSPSPSPPPAPPPAPLQTIRLEIKLGGPDNYAVDIADIARATGQRPPTPIRVISATTHSDSDDDDDQKGATSSKEDKAKSKKKKKKNPTFEHYDTSDPFIDDSELAIDERTYFAQTKQQGFYVSSGEVALLKDKTPKKPKSKNPLLSSVGVGGKKGLSMSAPVPGASKKPAANGAGSKEQPVPIASGSISEDENKPPGAGVYTVGDPRVGEKRKRYVTVIEGGKKRKVVDVVSPTS